MEGENNFAGLAIHKHIGADALSAFPLLIFEERARERLHVPSIKHNFAHTSTDLSRKIVPELFSLQVSGLIRVSRSDFC